MQANRPVGAAMPKYFLFQSDSETIINVNWRRWRRRRRRRLAK